MLSDLRHLRYFIATAEELHFRRAAERLGIAQPALSRAIQKLEAELGASLFRRNNRNVQITVAGEIFLARCREITSMMERGVEEVRNARDGRVGALRIGYTDFAIAGALPALLKGFQEHLPQITLKPQHGVTLTQLQLLDEGKLDFGFVTGPINREGIAQWPVQSERFVCVCPDTHPFVLRSGVTLGELSDQDFVLGSSMDWKHFYDHLMPMCRRAGFMPRIVQEAFNTAGILGLVSCGMGVTILTETVCVNLAPGLAKLPIIDLDERLITHAIWRRDRKEGPVAHFVDYLADLVLQTSSV